MAKYKVIFDGEEQDEVFSTAKDADGPAYDIQGRPVPQDSKHGFIIRNGRKMWRK